jgi:hypothetical protein
MRICALDAFNQQAFFWMAGNDDWAVGSAIEDRDANINTQAASFFERV